MEYLYLIITVALTVRFAHKLSGLIFLWWRKEYRLDRMRIHLSTSQGKAVLRSKSDAILAALILFWLIPGAKQAAFFGLFFYAMFLAGTYLYRIRSWLVPPRSPKVVALVFVFAFFVLCGVSLGAPLFISLAVIDLLMFPLSVPVVLLLVLPTKLHHARVISRAVKRLRKHAPMTVIGITGSYGKTSVKEYLSTILSAKYDTLKTEDSKNSPVGIAEVIQRKLTPSHRMFVVEMGAYKPGEIRDMADMVRPEIAVITAINPQHQDLFGSLETTMEAKYELISGLTGRRIVIINGDNAYTRQMGLRAKAEGCEVYWWTLEPKERIDRSVGDGHVFQASDIVSDVNGTSFSFRAGRRSIGVRARVVGRHQAGNILAAIMAGMLTGMTPEEAARAAENIRSVPGVMQMEKGLNGCLFIDDTFNNNPDAARAALSFLGTRTGRKYLVFQPMIELGTFSVTSHEDVGVLASGVCDAVIFTNPNFVKPFERGMRKGKKDVPLMVLSPTKAAEYLRTHVMKGDTVLFKGKDAKHTLDLLKAEMQ